MKMSGIPASEDKDGADRIDGDVLPAHSVGRGVKKIVKTSVASTVVSLSASAKTQQPDGDTILETLSIVLQEINICIGCLPEELGAADEVDADMGEVSGSGLVAPGCGHDGVIVGSGDRAHHLALKFANIAVTLRQETIARPAMIPARRPLSRTECHRRCGSGGFCDPSSELGCGGEYCGNRYAF